MFSGIVEEVAGVREVLSGGLWLDVSFAGELSLGQSICCSGVCLSVVEKDERGFRVDVVAETRSKTYLMELKPGDEVNVERALQANGRFDGHIVQGHVDAVAEVISVSPARDELLVGLPVSLNNYVVHKGSICLDGVSLTVAEVLGSERLPSKDLFVIRLALIPHTLSQSNLGAKKVGSKLHVEVDILAKYVEKMLSSKV